MLLLAHRSPPCDAPASSPPARSGHARRAARSATRSAPATLHPHSNPPTGPPPPLLRSYLLYLWYSSLLRLGFRRTLQYEDVFDVPDALKTGHLEPRFAAEFARQKALAAALPGDKVRARCAGHRGRS